MDASFEISGLFTSTFSAPMSHNYAGALSLSFCLKHCIRSTTLATMYGTPLHVMWSGWKATVQGAPPLTYLAFFFHFLSYSWSDLKDVQLKWNHEILSSGSFIYRI